MTRWTRFIPVVAIGLALSACGTDPVGTDLREPAGPRMDGGVGTGGSYTGGGGTGSTGSTTTTTTEPVPSDSTGRGGVGTGGS